MPIIGENPYCLNSYRLVSAKVKYLCSHSCNALEHNDNSFVSSSLLSLLI